MTKSPKVLLVDSDSFMHRVYATRLMSNGYEIISAKSADDAVNLSSLEKPDAILCDTGAYGGMGLQIVESIKSNKQTEHIPVVCLSNSWDEEHKTKAILAGAHVFGIKSHLTPIEVAAHIDTLVS